MKQRVTSLTSLVNEASQQIASYARWPDVPNRALAADNAIIELRQALRGNDPVIFRAIMLALVADLLDGMTIRDAPVRGMRLAFDKMIDIFDPEKDVKKQ